MTAQRYELLEGDLKNLKGISEYNITFDYSNMKVHGYETEEAFLNDKMEKRSNVEGKAEKIQERMVQRQGKPIRASIYCLFQQAICERVNKVGKRCFSKIYHERKNGLGLSRLCGGTG